MGLFHDSDKLCKVTVAGSFAQDGGVCSSSTASTALCDGRLYSDVTKGCTSRKTYLSNAHTQPCCGSNIDKHSEPNTELRIVNSACGNSKNAVYKETRVAASDNKKMKIFYINGFDDKYSSFILIKSCYEGKSVLACNAITHELWKSQTDFNFSFIPFGDLRLSDSNEINNMTNYCPITAHKIVKQYNKPNYLGTRLKVDSQLNLDEWKKRIGWLLGHAAH